MDKHNRFFTPTLYRMVRMDWAVIMIALMAISAYNWREVNWWTFGIMFWWIDLIGTVPGSYYQKKHADQPVPKWTIVAYNFCHSFTTVIAITFVWYLISGPEWAMLAMPMHLAADRSVFGNIYKRFEYKFEPDASPIFARFDEDYTRAQASIHASTEVRTAR